MQRTPAALVRVCCFFFSFLWFFGSRATSSQCPSELKVLSGPQQRTLCTRFTSFWMCIQNDSIFSDTSIRIKLGVTAVSSRALCSATSCYRLNARRQVCCRSGCTSRRMSTSTKQFFVAAQKELLVHWDTARPTARLHENQKKLKKRSKLWQQAAGVLCTSSTISWFFIDSNHFMVDSMSQARSPC